MLLGGLFVLLCVSPQAGTQRPALPFVVAGGSRMKVWMRSLAVRRFCRWCPRWGFWTLERQL
jgi:hypothetical protein